MLLAFASAALAADSARFFRIAGPVSATITRVSPQGEITWTNALTNATFTLEAIQRSTEFLGRKGVDSPRLQTELLLAHLLQQLRMRLYLSLERVLAPAEVDAFRELIRRRGQRERLQHIVGSACFCGLEIAVNRHALIPRPETELLAERGWESLNELASGANKAPAA